MIESNPRTPSPVKPLRKRKSLSQRALAEKAGISRGRLRRLENEQFEHATYGELKSIACALEMDVRELVHPEVSNSNPGLAYLTKAGETAFEVDLSTAGVKISSFHPRRDDLFSGRIVVRAKQCLTRELAPRAELLFLQVLFGALLVRTSQQVYAIDEGDSLVFSAQTPYSLENPRLRDSVALIVTFPSFPV